MALEVLKGKATAGKPFKYKNVTGGNRSLLYILTNTGAASVNLHITIEEIYIAPKNLEIEVNETTRDENLVLLQGETLSIKPTGGIDYYIVLKDVTNN